jgi:hypothetical protein
MQGFALGHPVVFVVFLVVIVVRLLQQRLKRHHGLHIGRRGSFELGKVRLDGVCLFDALLAVGRVVNRVGAIDDPLLAGMRT